MPAAVVKAERYAQVEKLLSEINSQRSIVRLTGVGARNFGQLNKKARTSSLLLPSLRSKKAQK